MKKINKNKGFTLIELVVVIVITGILSIVALSGINAFLKTLSLVTTNINLMHDINNSSTRFELDVRNIEIDTTGSNNIPQVTSFSESSFSFTKNNGDAVTYLISGNNLLRNGSNILFNELDASQSSFAFSGYSGGVEVDAISAGLPADEVRKVTFTYMITQDEFEYQISQTFALNYR